MKQLFHDRNYISEYFSSQKSEKNQKKFFFLTSDVSEDFFEKELSLLFKYYFCTLRSFALRTNYIRQFVLIDYIF